MAVPTENQESEALANRLKHNDYSFTHIANESGIGGKGAMLACLRKKRMGLSPGAPDYMIILKNNSMCFIELKKQKEVKKNGKGYKKVANDASKDQLKWIKELNECKNVSAGICYGYKDSTDFILMLEAS